MQNIKNIDQLNQNIEATLKNIADIPAEDEKSDELVQSLLELVGKRQSFVAQFISSDDIGADTLQKQLALTKKYTEQVKVALQHRQDLLSKGRSNKRQINVYQSINSNR
ncbi:hypothetical protein ACFOD0_07715 [Shewanella intestini]|uniref:Flagella biosynthesis chaperone for FliD, FliT n=1 Tax=Shewanella intestini TaxID=2017544 RepID=A0ABS5HYH2_9GAMM|nr:MULTISPECIES: hypothetical protein [Shewanella]MBR9726762.1 hypothetical protein [Shewanella intestini]MRG34672.1 hypothetical protein [Shewanella sp. XMDDZSB0408]